MRINHLRQKINITLVQKNVQVDLFFLYFFWVHVEKELHLKNIDINFKWKTFTFEEQAKYTIEAEMYYLLQISSPHS